MGIFGWSYPPGAEDDPNAPYNQDFIEEEDEEREFNHNQEERYYHLARTDPSLLEDRAELFHYWLNCASLFTDPQGKFGGMTPTDDDWIDVCLDNAEDQIRRV